MKIKKSVKIALVIPPSERVKVMRTAYSPPLGLMSIGASLKEMAKSADVSIFNGEIYPTEELLIEDIFNYSPDIIGISTNVGCYRFALEIAKKTKRQNNIIILGGPYASVMWKTCLENRPYVDYCVVGDGEIPMVNLANGSIPEQTAGFAIRNASGKPYLNLQEDPPLDNYPDPDWSLIDAVIYQKKYRQTYDQSDAVFASINAMKGCLWQEKSGGCVFCALRRSTLRKRSPERVWQEINRLYENYGCNHFWELSDTIGCDINWLRRFVALKPNRPISFRGYLRSSEATREAVKILAILGYKEVFIGIESGDNRILKAANKGTTIAQNMMATIALNTAGIKTFASVVLGLPGETKESLQATYKHVLDLFDNGLHTLSVCIFSPYVGSPAFCKLMTDKNIGDEYKNQDIFDFPELSRLWVRTQCHCSWDDIMEYSQQLSAIPSSLYEDNFTYIPKNYDV